MVSTKIKPTRENKVKDFDILNKYYEDISKFDLLTATEEVDISKRILFLKENSTDKTLKLDIEEILFLKQKMTNANLRLVVSIAKRFNNRGLSISDLISEGNIGLLSAIDHYDYSKGCRFSTYGTWWIKQSITKAITDTTRDIRLPIHVQTSVKQYSKAKSVLTQKLQRNPNHSEISKSMHVADSKMAKVLMLTQGISSLNTVIDENSSTLLELIPDLHNPEPFEEVYSSNLEEIMSDVLDKLTEKEKKVITLRFGFNGTKPMTLEELGEIMGLTRERIRQIQEKACQKMSHFRVLKELRDYN